MWLLILSVLLNAECVFYTRITLHTRAHDVVLIKKNTVMMLGQYCSCVFSFFTIFRDHTNPVEISTTRRLLRVSFIRLILRSRVIMRHSLLRCPSFGFLLFFFIEFSFSRRFNVVFPMRRVR